jgi:fused signal recognition particle receptor
MGLFEKLKQGLSKTRGNFADKLDQIFKKKLDEETLEDLEELLITADVGVNVTQKLIENLNECIKKREIRGTDDIKRSLKNEIKDCFPKKTECIKKPCVIMVVGVNGVGKTTSIGKLAYLLKNRGYSVLLAAADTFRAAAAEQLQIWGQRAGVDVIRHQEGSDPASVLYDTIQAAKARKIDVVICDTAGRLHTKKNLMEELKKLYRVSKKEYPEANLLSLMVLDATTGQNALSQARIFKDAGDISGIILTKLDGTAKGGIVIAVALELDIPVWYIGLGEGIEDMQEFDADLFLDAIL